jgi:hypothetical protein
MPRLSKIGAAALAAFGWTGLSSVSASYLVVAGGAGGGWKFGGGGGAGGYQTGTISLNPTLSYTVTVGAGGSGAPNGNTSTGTAGSNSVFSSITSAGGGGGASQSQQAGSGGSGGGASNDNTTLKGSGNTPSTSPSQGNDGGNGAVSSGGGGGGSSSVGVAGSGSNGGNGGNATSNSISGSAVTYAGGGGGGCESGTAGTGQGGGGNGSNSAATNGGNAEANRGSGGGGSGWGGSNTANGGSGGSGIVIISYPSPQKFGGGVVTSSGGNTIHTFTTSGTLSPLSSLTANFLVIAGGGGGGGDTGAGGGAGGYRTSAGTSGGGASAEATLTIDSNSIYLVTVGSGGAKGATVSNGGSGGASSFYSISTTGGGGGGTNAVAGLSGGSGGGAGYSAAGGAGTANQGYAGGNGGPASSNYTGGGGGGAGAVGTAGTATVGGNGGNGVSSSISGTAVTRAGGGGGGTFSGGTLGTGGSGGGGNAGASDDGDINTGSGGGGAKNNGTDSGNGGSGIVIISYPGSTQQMAGGTVTVAGGNVIHTFTSSGYLTPIVLVTNSLRFRSSASASLTRTPTVTSNRTTWTWSGWIKRGAVDSGLYTPFAFGDNSTGATDVGAFSRFNNNVLEFSEAHGGVNSFALTTTQVFRDPSAWYHIVFVADTTQATASNRLRIFVNGNQVTAFTTATYPTQNFNTSANQAGVPQRIGVIDVDGTAAGQYFDGYMADINFIDGQALTPNSFGTFNGLGVWQPIRYGGSYGTNGFYLPFTNSGNISADYLVVAGGGGGGTARGGGGGAGGFRTGTLTLALAQSYTVTVGGGGTSGAAGSAAQGGVGSNSVFSSITSSGGGGGGTDSGNASAGGSGGGGGGNGGAGGAGTSGQGNNGGNGITPVPRPPGGGGGASAVGGNGVSSTAGSGGAGTASSISGSSITYAGGGGGGAFTNGGGIAGAGGAGGGGAGSTTAAATAGTTNRGGGGGGGGYDSSDISTAGGAGGSGIVVISYAGSQRFTGGTITSSGGNTIHTFTSSGTLGLGIAADYSPNGNNWTTNNISLTAGSTYDSMTDVPTLTSATTANYCTWNPVGIYVTTPLDGNLKISGTSAGANGTIGASSGKFYWECVYTAIGSAEGVLVGIRSTDSIATGAAENVGYYGGGSENGKKTVNGVASAYAATWTTNDVIGVAVDLDGGTVTFYKNNVSQGAISFTVGGKTWTAFNWRTGAAGTNTATINFGQQPFTYTPPTGFVRLNTFNLPTPTIGATASTTANKYMDVSLYTGNGSTQSITNSGSMQPDFVWLKRRSSGNSHGLFDSIRGVNKYLSSDTTGAEATIANSMTAFNSNGFSLGTDSTWNLNTSTNVGWQWRASGSTVTNTAGSITSTVSANTTAGFSIVTFAYPGSGNGTVGHGLGVAPSMIILKSRVNTYDWIVYHQSLGSGKAIRLNTTGAEDTSTNWWNSTSPTSTVFSIGTNYNGGGNSVAYCFAEVAGYSAFGSYTGNGSADGPFIFTGFRPKFILHKCSSAAGDGWLLYDTVRQTYNVVGAYLQPNLSNAEGNTTVLDILSNGFKLRSTFSSTNGTGLTYIYMAFAENPFKYANAR